MAKTMYETIYNKVEKRLTDGQAVHIAKILSFDYCNSKTSEADMDKYGLIDFLAAGDLAQWEVNIQTAFKLFKYLERIGFSFLINYILKIKVD